MTMALRLIIGGFDVSMVSDPIDSVDHGWFVSGIDVSMVFGSIEPHKI